MNNKLKRNLLIIATNLCILPSFAQLSSNPYKFLGNITTSYNVDAGGGIPSYYKRGIFIPTAYLRFLDAASSASIFAVVEMAHFFT